MKFIHAADIHIDSPLRGLEAYEAAPVDRLREATREAFAQLVQIALEETIDFVLIAGDLFDGDWKEMNTGLWVAQQFRRLQSANIPVFLIRGNHDAASEVTKRLTWPDNVRELSTEAPETVVVEQLQVAIHGQGFSHQKVTDNLALTYPAALPGYFNIGLLHTSLGGHPEHDTYAPASVNDLMSRGYQYWALGHIHKQEIVQENPFVVYPGNIQGRHIRESGPKGCFVVTVEEQEVTSIEHRDTDVARWNLLTIPLEEDDQLPELYQRVRQQLETLYEEADGRLIAVRLIFTGPTEVHHEIFRAGKELETVAEIRNIANDFQGDVWVEKIKWNTSPPYNLEQLRRGNDLVGELLRHIEQLRNNPDGLQELAKEFEPIRARAAHEIQKSEVLLDDPDVIRDWLQQAENLLVSRLLEESE